jgi:hypothetical protein
VALPTVLLVAPSPSFATAAIPWLADAGFRVTVVGSYEAAKSHITDRLSLLISEVRLGDYNGLHLGIRAKARGIPAIVIGDHDPVLEREAEALGVRYLRYRVGRTGLLDAVVSVARPTPEDAALADGVASSLSFISWHEIVPAIGSLQEISSRGSRRTLPS